MNTLLCISEAASIGWHAMILLAAGEEHLVATSVLAGRLQVSQAHLSKVIQRLARAGLIQTVRGPGGGVRLGRPAASITLLGIYEAIEGPLQERSCLLREPICNGQCCILGDLFQRVDELRDALAAMSLQEATARSLGHTTMALG